MRPLRSLAALLLAALAAGGGACASMPTSQQRAESYRPFEGRLVDAEPLAQFLSERTAILYAGASVTTAAKPDGTLSIQVHRSGEGAAVAVTQDGYFLTAAHCVDEEPVLLLLTPRPGTCHIGRARIVWRDEESDLALVHAPVTVTAWFAWAAEGEVVEDAPLVGVGCSSLDDLHLGDRLGMTGGRALAAPMETRPASADRPRVVAVATDLPIAPGDSGGALALPDGRLVAIHVSRDFGVFFPKLRTSWSISVRPDTGWLEARIARDRRERP